MKTNSQNNNIQQIDGRKFLSPYLQAQKTAELFINSITDEEGDNDDACLEKFRQNEFFQEMVENLTNADFIEENLARDAKRDKEEDIYKLFTLLEKAEKKEKRSRRLKMSITGIAVAVLFISFMIYSPFAKEEMMIIRPNIELAIDKPTLVVEDGEAYLVSEIKKDEKRGMEKISDNKIIYHAKEEKVMKEEQKADIKLVANEVKMNKLYVPAKNTTEIILADGTEITLNANTILEYPSQFEGDTREVTIQGEGYFSVSKSDKPFIVNTASGKVTVYGTEFNVNCRKQLGTDIVLVEGSVGFKSDNYVEVVLKPNERLYINPENNTAEITEVNTYSYTAWRDNMFSYKAQSFYDIIQDIAQWYGIEFRVKGLNDKSHYTFVLDRNTDVLETIENLAFLANVKIINEGGGVYVIE